MIFIALNFAVFSVEKVKYLCECSEIVVNERLKRYISIKTFLNCWIWNDSRNRANINDYPGRLKPLYPEIRWFELISTKRNLKILLAQLKANINRFLQNHFNNFNHVQNTQKIPPFYYRKKNYQTKRKKLNFFTFNNETQSKKYRKRRNKRKFVIDFS